jgi:hypothetical protein
MTAYAPYTAHQGELPLINHPEVDLEEWAQTAPARSSRALHDENGNPLYPYMGHCALDGIAITDQKD